MKRITFVNSTILQARKLKYKTEQAKYRGSTKKRGFRKSHGYKNPLTAPSNIVTSTNVIINLDVSSPAAECSKDSVGFSSDLHGDLAIATREARFFPNESLVYRE